MDYALYLRAILSLAFVLGLMLALFWLLKRFNLVQPAIGPRARTRRLAIVETLALDARRRLMLIRRDGVEHLVIVGANGELLVETGIPVPPELPETGIGTS